MVEKKSFTALLKYQRPATTDADIPGRTKLHEEVIEKAKVATLRLKEHFKVLPFYLHIAVF